MTIVVRVLLSYMMFFAVCTPCVFASTIDENAAQQVLDDIKLRQSHHIQHVIIKNDYAYVLTTSNYDNKILLEVHEVRKLSDGEWIKDGGAAIQVMDKPWKLFRRNRKNLKYSLTRMSGERNGLSFQYDWCLIGYTTDPDVLSFRIKTQTCYIPMQVINKRYFMRIMNETERMNFIEVQGLNEEGKVIQRDNGVDEDKPRQWSPQHSEIY